MIPMPILLALPSNPITTVMAANNYSQEGEKQVKHSVKIYVLSLCMEAKIAIDAAVQYLLQSVFSL